MNHVSLHSWDLDFSEARALQTELASRLRLEPLKKSVKLVAGCDVSSAFRGRKFWAAAAALTLPDFEIIETATASAEVDFPYIPGLLSFREMPVLLKAFEKLDTVPDLIFCDGSGMIHPRKFGLACHLGLWLDLPVIGCAKNLLCGEHQPLPPGRGCSEIVYLEGEALGAVVRTRQGVKPVYISPGNLITPEEAVTFILAATPRYRLPEPIRAAHRLANQARQESAGSGR